MFAPRIDESKRKPMRGVRERWIFAFLLAGSLVGILGLFPTTIALAQESPDQKYGPDVVAKADKILEENGLRRSGKTIAATNTSEVSRALSTLNRERRQLRLVYQDWKKAADHEQAIRNEIKRLTIQDGELNLQLARVSDAAANNRLVGLINASRAKKNLLADEAETAHNQTLEKRSKLGDAESEYAETILAIRKDFNAVRDKITASLSDSKTRIALKVMTQNFETPADITATKILAALDKRIERVEQEVFSETIPLEVEGSGSMFVNVVVGTKTTRMVVDSGATLISLPSKTAQELGIKVPVDAPQLRLIMADGREISARAVVLKRVRVGEFEAEDVRAAVLDPIAIGAEPLLGMSYLGNFKFEIDAAEKTLKMLRVSAE